MAEEKTERNTEIYCKKDGYENPKDPIPTKEPVTYRELSKEYDLSYTVLQRIINRLRERYKEYKK